MFFIIKLSDFDTKKMDVKVFGELGNMVLEENGENKIVREFSRSISPNLGITRA